MIFMTFLTFFDFYDFYDFFDFYDFYDFFDFYDFLTFLTFLSFRPGRGVLGPPKSLPPSWGLPQVPGASQAFLRPPARHIFLTFLTFMFFCVLVEGLPGASPGLPGA